MQVFQIRLPSMSGRTHSIPIDNPFRAILFMIAAGLLNTVMLSAIKQLSEELHAFEIAFFRCLVGFMVLLPMVWQTGGVMVLRTKRIGRHVLRSALNAGGMLLFFWAISLAPLATVSAIGFASPLFAALLAIPILGEKVGLRRWSGLIIGFIGTIIILRPGAGIVDLGALLALFSSILWAGAMITIKQLTSTETPLSITTWASLFVGIFCLGPAVYVWQWPTAEQCIWLALIGTLGSAIQFCFAKAFSLADTTVVLPFDFLKLVWASLFGFVLFAEIPDPWVWVGGTIIFASAVYVAYRERVKRQSQSQSS
ncbi:MAG TPA: DMT family transporter [Kiloniellaceae bacterium]|nr:DMT family transporter [Kiloniellaceae bacterium]